MKVFRFEKEVLPVECRLKWIEQQLVDDLRESFLNGEFFCANENGLMIPAFVEWLQRKSFYAEMERINDEMSSRHLHRSFKRSCLENF